MSNIFGVVNEKCAKIYSEPDIRSEVICTIYGGDEVQYLGTTFDVDLDEWYKVCTEHGLEGFADAGSIIILF